jgi:Potential Queuosine, Q, salvage protein family
MLRKAGTILQRDWDSDFANIVKKSDKSAQKLISLVIDVFGDLFDDSLIYGGCRVMFQKRVQILVADIW